MLALQSKRPVTLYLIRGLPRSGKELLKDSLPDCVHLTVTAIPDASADPIKNSDAIFDSHLQACTLAMCSLQNAASVTVTGVMPQFWELAMYEALAEQMSVSLFVINVTGGDTDMDDSDKYLAQLWYHGSPALSGQLVQLQHLIAQSRFIDQE